MAYAPVQLVSTTFDNYTGYWIKFYEQGTTTPLSMAPDATGLPLIVQAEISSGGTVPSGFIKTSGDALLNPHLDAAYDCWLFSTEALATANTTTNAIQIADNVDSDSSNTATTALRADLASTSDVANGDALLGVKKTITGALSTTQHAVNEERPVLVGPELSTGGTGTSGDPWIGWESLLNGLPGDSAIKFASGFYTIISVITAKEGWRVFGDGKWNTTITCSSDLLALNPFTVNGVDHVEFHDFALIGDSGNLPLSGFFIQNTTGSKVYNCRIKDINHEGVALNASAYDCEVYGNYIEDVSTSIGWGIGLFQDIKRCAIHHNTILDCGAYGILLDDGTSGQADPVPCVGNIIHNNFIFTTTTNMWGISIEGGTDNIVHNNYIEIISTYGMEIAEGNSTVVKQPLRNTFHSNTVRMKTSVATTGMRIIGGSDNIVRNNHISAGDVGINVAEPTSGVAMVGNIIDGNHFYDLNGSGSNKIAILQAAGSVAGLTISNNEIKSSGGRGILVQTGDDITVKGNMVNDTQKEGIHVEGTGITGIKVIYNEVTNAGLLAAATYAAIEVNATSASITNCVVAHNIIDDNQGSVTTWAGVVMQGTGAVFINTRVYDNIILESTLNPMIILSPTQIDTRTPIRDFTGGSVNPGWFDEDDVIAINATSNVTVAAPSAHVAQGSSVTFIITQDATGGRTVTWNSSYKNNWSDTGNTSSQVSSITFIRQGVNFIQRTAQVVYL